MSNEFAESRDRSGRPKWLGRAQPALIAVVVLIALYFARAPERIEIDVSSGLAGGSGRPSVNVVQPTATDQALTVELTGAVRLEERVTAMSEVPGRVVWVSPDFRNGGTVAANEPMVRIDPAKYELEVEAAQAAVAEAEARVAAQGGSAAEAALASARAALGMAELALDRTEISYPYESRIVSSNVGVGELAGPPEFAGAQAILGEFYRSDALEVEAPIETDDLEYLAPVIGRPARIVSGSQTFDGEIVRTSSVLSPRTRLASVFFRFSDNHPADSLPLPGAFVEIEIDGPAYQNVYVLPDSVLQERDAVWVVRGGALDGVVPQAHGRVDAGLVVQAFDAGEGVLVGTLPGAAQGIEVEVLP